MEPLKEQIINYVLRFIAERSREVITSDIYYNLAHDFESELAEKCKDTPLMDTVYIESTVREMHIVYELIYDADEGRLTGLTKKGWQAATHKNGVVGFLKEKEEKKKEEKYLQWINAFFAALGVMVVLATFVMGQLTPSLSWTDKVGYLLSGFLIGLSATPLMKTLLRHTI